MFMKNLCACGVAMGLTQMPLYFWKQGQELLATGYL
jgi:hypothetical protein